MKATAIFLASAALLLSAHALAAQQAATGQPAAPAPQPPAGQEATSTPQAAGSASSSSDEDMFGSPETVTQADNVSKEAQGQSNFLKYDQVKVGGSFMGKVGLTSAWASPWDGSERLIPSTSDYVTPDIQGDVTIVAKPLVDFGVNMDFRTSWPFTISSANSTLPASRISRPPPLRAPAPAPSPISPSGPSTRSSIGTTRSTSARGCSPSPGA